MGTKGSRYSYRAYKPEEVTTRFLNAVFDRMDSENMSMHEFGRRTGVCHSTVPRWLSEEYGIPTSVFHFANICKECGVSMDYIMFGEEIKHE